MSLPNTYDTIAPEDLGRGLTGLGVNLLCRDLRGMAAFLVQVFGLHVHQLSDDFALVRHGEALFQLHSDGSFSSHPLHGLLPESSPRGTGAQIYLFGIDPDLTIERAEAAGGVVIEPPADKPHGLREATILSPEGYAFSPAIARRMP